MLAEQLEAWVERLAPADAAAWLAQTRAGLGGDRMRLRLAFARAGRKLGGGSADIDLPGAGGAWTLRDVGRAALVATVLDAADDPVALVDELFRRGESGEQESILRILPVLPEPQRFVAVAVESCRTNSENVFTAIACDNPYPAQYFPEDNFNQMVLKALFVGVPVARIVDLSRRVTPELCRMARGYGNERAAAGRSVPADIAKIESMLESAR